MMNIAIWGIGDVGQYVFQQLKNNEKLNIKYFVDSNSEYWETVKNGIKVISPIQLKNVFSDEVDFLVIAFINGVSIYEQLLEMETKPFGIVNDCVFEEKMELEQDLLKDKNIFWKHSGNEVKPLLKTLETNIVDYCNLNCRGCSHFSNLFEYGEKVPFNIFRRDLNQIAEHLHIYRFNMLGGEPLLDSEINQYIEYARKILPDTNIQLITNGILIPKQPKSFFDCCKENNVRIVISEYQPTLELKNQIVEILHKNEVRYFLRDNRGEFGKNIDLTGTTDKDWAVKHCRESRCQFFRNGKIYKCPFEALGNRLFECYGVDIRLSGGYDIYQGNLDWADLADTLMHQTVDACKYCGEEEKMKWEKRKVPKLEDWIIKR